jgi:hypothetical protein
VVVVALVPAVLVGDTAIDVPPVLDGETGADVDTVDVTGDTSPVVGDTGATVPVVAVLDEPKDPVATGLTLEFGLELDAPVVVLGLRVLKAGDSVPLPQPITAASVAAKVSAFAFRMKERGCGREPVARGFVSIGLSK